jgi:hypothetical protein
MFQLAWDNKGYIVDLTKVPDDMLKMFVQWRNEKVAEEAENQPTVGRH